MTARARLLGQAANAIDHFAPSWPLQTFISTNPLSGFEAMPFEDAVILGQRLFGGRGYPNAAMIADALATGRIDQALAQDMARERGLDLPDPRQLRSEASTGRWQATADDLVMARWLRAFFDEGQAALPMPGRDRGFYRSWRELACHDPMIANCQGLLALPDDPLDALDLLVAPLADADREAAFIWYLARLPGWARHIRWRVLERDRHGLGGTMAVVDVLAVRLAIAWLSEEPIHMAARQGREVLSPPVLSVADTLHAFWLDVWEETWRRQLTATLTANPAGDAGRALPERQAQLVFCMDVRSEVLRRCLEAVGPYETYAMAGFFGASVRILPVTGGAPYPSCPIHVNPRHVVAETPMGGHAGLAARHRCARSLRQLLHQLRHRLRQSLTGTSILSQTAGMATGLVCLIRTLWPQRLAKLGLAIRQRILPPVPVLPSIGLTQADGDDVVYGLSPAEQVFFAATALKLMGLTGDTAPLVILCGHRGSSTNNSYAAQYHCSACGARPGGPGARVMAALLNRPEVRGKLATEAGIHISSDTLFLAAEHDTGTDVVTVAEPGPLGETHALLLQRLRSDLDRASAAAATERLLQLDGQQIRDPLQAAERRVNDWAQTRPEWGLARNAAIIIGDRELTHGRNFAGRAFLHSYRWQQDSDGSMLEVILTGPVVVAQWINLQYYFSTVDNDVYGAGPRAGHNLVGGFAVMAGDGDDLRAGLPWEAVACEDGSLWHEPLRLMIVIKAPRARVERIIQRNSSTLSRMFGNGWASLMVIDPSTGTVDRLGRDGCFVPARLMDGAALQAVPC